MKGNTITTALGVLAIGTRAQQAIAPEAKPSVLMALAQAMPPDSVSYALASPSAFAAAVASSLSAGNTPTWYQALPTDVQNLLPQIYPAAVETTPPPTPTPSSSSSSSSSSAVENSSVIITTPYPTASNSTLATPTLSATGGASASVTLGPSDTASPTPDSPAPFTGAASQLSVAASSLAAAVVLGMLVL